jgi:hypothetical protein
MFQRSPLSLMGWLALLAALGSAGLAVVAFMLPSVDDYPRGGDLSDGGAHTLPSGRAAELCDIRPGNTALHLSRLAGGADGGAGSSGAGVESAHTDHDWVCGEIGLPAAGRNGPRPRGSSCN